MRECSGRRERKVEDDGMRVGEKERVGAGAEGGMDV